MLAVRDSVNKYETLAQDAAKDVEKTKTRRSLQHRENIKRRHELLRRRNTRMHAALSGLQTLTEFRELEQVQELISLRGSLTLYSGTDTWVDYGIYLRADATWLKALSYGIAYGNNDSIRGRLSEPDAADSFSIRIATADHLVNSRAVRDIFSFKRYDIPGFYTEKEDSDYEQERRAHLRDAHAEELLFQVLVDCANPKKFQYYAKLSLQ